MRGNRNKEVVESVLSQPSLSEWHVMFCMVLIGLIFLVLVECL